jgi:ElaB/YqjD/DUF883 family membrane-anchored ribosome-binding protein
MSNDPTTLKYMGTQSQETMNMAAALAHDAVGKAKSTLQSAADRVRSRATSAVATYTRDDPVRAVLIAAGAGALAMVVLAMTARSGVRKVRRSVRR